MSIRREGELLFPRGSTIILPGDVVTFLVNSRGEERLRQYLADRVFTAVSGQQKISHVALYDTLP